MTTLSVMVGLPCSGKSTYCKNQLAMRQWAIVNPDSFRLALHGEAFNSKAESTIWYLVDMAIKGLLLAGQSVVLDATNVCRQRRVRWHQLAKSIGVDYEVLVVATPVGACLSRNKEINRMDPSIIINMAKAADFFDYKGDEVLTYV